MSTHQSELARWLGRVLNEGVSIQTAPPLAQCPSDAMPILKAAFDRQVLDLAASVIEWDARVGTQAALTLAQACWGVAYGADDTTIEMPGEPAEASGHLSADVTLRLLPMVYRRAKARAAESPLTQSLTRILRAWPLSGVLADVIEPPTSPLTFAGHAGLQLLYAERLVLLPRSAWLPPAGPAQEWVERIFEERGRVMPASVAEESAHD